MDNPTHTLTGVLLARSGLNRLTPKAVWIAAIAANIPDIDVVSLVSGPGAYLAYHRGLTHAIVSIPVMALLPVGIVAAIFRQKLPWIRAWLLSMIAVVSHLLLDYTNPYGIRLLLPWSDGWPALDITNVVDLWIWAILLIGVVWPLLSGLVSSEIGARRSPGQGIAITALLLFAAYDTARYFFHERAVQLLQSRIYDGSAPKRVLAFPDPANPMQWWGWVETERSWQSMPVTLTQEFDPQPEKVYYKADPSPVIDVAMTLPDFKRFAHFAKAPHWSITPAGEPRDAVRVELKDLTFGFNVRALVGGDGRVLESQNRF